MQREANLRFEALNYRFDEVVQGLAIDQRIKSIERELAETRKAS
jgi:hypothetical protein